MPQTRHTTERDEIKINLNFLELNIAILNFNSKSTKIFEYVCTCRVILMLITQPKHRLLKAMLLLKQLVICCTIYFELIFFQNKPCKHTKLNHAELNPHV